jgi:cobalt/nickel transport system permease protein
VAGSLVVFGAVFGVTQVPLAVAEGLLTVLVVRLLVRVAADDLARLRVLAPAGRAA